MTIRQEEIFSRYLKDLKHLWEGELLHKDPGSDRSDAAFAQDFLGATSKSYSEWKRAVRLPNDDNLRTAAAAVNDMFGRQMADRMFLAAGRQPQFVTNDERLRYMIDHFDDLTSEEQDKMLEEMRSIIEQRGTGINHHNSLQLNFA